MIERWPDRHYPESEDDVEAGLDALLARKDVCKGPVGVVGVSRGPYFAIRLAARRPRDIAAIVSYYGHFHNPNAPEPQQLFSIAPEVSRITTPMPMLISDADFELRRIVNGRAYYALYERGVAAELQMYPMARCAFDFRRDATPEKKIATRHARQRARAARAAHEARRRRALPVAEAGAGGWRGDAPGRPRARRLPWPRGARPTGASCAAPRPLRSAAGCAADARA